VTSRIPFDSAAPPLGFGAAQLGNLYRPTDDETSRRAVDAAWELGVRYFDTAPHYGLGLSERRLGAALASRPRDQYAISTKVGRLLVPTPEHADRLDDGGFAVPAAFRRTWDFSRDGILRSLDASLDRLGLDRIDIVYLHDPDEHWAAASTTGVGALIELRDQGVIGAVGAGMNQSAVLAEFVRRCDIDLVMLAGRYTLLDQSAADDLLPAAAERGVGVVAAGAYNSGLLSSDRIPDDAKYDYADAPAAVLARARRIAEICAQHGVALPAAAVQFPLRRPEVVSVVLGTRTAEQIVQGAERMATAVPDALWSDLAAQGLVRP